MGSASHTSVHEGSRGGDCGTWHSRHPAALVRSLRAVDLRLYRLRTVDAPGITIGHAVHVLYYFAIFSHDPVSNISNEPCISSHTDVTATAETSVVRFISFHPIKTNLEGGNYYAYKLLFSNMVGNY